MCGLNVSDRCDFVRSNPDCRSEGGYLDYLEGIFCHFAPGLLPLAITLCVRPWLGAGERGAWPTETHLPLFVPTQVLWLLYLFLVLGVTAAKL